MGPDLNQMSVFAAVVEAGSFTAAAKALGMPKSTVSKRVADLEERLGARLLQRSTRQVKVTASGAAYFTECRRIVAEAREADRAITPGGGAPRGVVRISIPWLLEETLAPALERFLLENPGVSLDVRVTNRRVDLIAEGIDLAIRPGALPDSSLVSRRLGATEHCVCASPDYLAGRGPITNPDALRDHDCIRLAGKGEPQLWTFERQGKKISVPLRGRYAVSSGALMRRGAIAGLGVAAVPEFLVVNDLAAGRLVRLLAGWTIGRGAVHLVYASRRHLSPGVRALVDWLVATFSEDAPWTRRGAAKGPTTDAAWASDEARARVRLLTRRTTK